MYKLALSSFLALVSVSNAFTVPNTFSLSTRTVSLKTLLVRTCLDGWISCCCNEKLIFYDLFQTFAPSTTARNILLSDEETETIFNKATDCAEGECSLDDVNDLLSELNAQQKILSDRLAQVTNMIDTLAGVNDKEEREVDEVRQYVRDLLRVFNNDVSIKHALQKVF